MQVSLALPLLGLFGPMIAAIVVVKATDGWQGLRELWRRFKVAKGHLLWLVIALLIPPLMLLPVWLLERATVPSTNPSLGSVTAISFVLALLIVGEEVGWRGFGLPWLLHRSSPLASSVIVGVVWGLWHLPNFLLDGYPHKGLPFPAFLLSTVAYSVIFTWLHLRTAGSLVVAVAFHASLNLCYLTGIDEARQYWWEAAAYTVAALAIVTGGGIRTDRELESGG